MAEMAAAFYGYPQREMMMLGVTGTNGKTTTTYMVKAIAEQAGKKVGVIGTIRNLIGNESIHTDRTTPESVDLFRILRMMADAHVDMVVMETSSHALEQFRVHGIKFDVGLFTNLTQDHLDYHKSFDNYLAAKKTALPKQQESGRQCGRSVFRPYHGGADDTDPHIRRAGQARISPRRISTSRPTAYTSTCTRRRERCAHESCHTRILLGI